MKHTFACHVENLTAILAQYTSTDHMEINDSDLLHRVTSILRLHTGEQIIFFDKEINVLALISAATFTQKKKVHCELLSQQENLILKPQIKLLQCITKKDTFEDIAYASAALGICEIQPIISQKSFKNWWTEHDEERLKRIMLGACEQAKNFTPPLLKTPIKFENIEAAVQNANLKICFDSDGMPISQKLNNFSSDKFSMITALFGSEGGLSSDELTKLEEMGFELCKLTPTILRSKEAAVVGLGLLRSMLN